MRFVDHGHTATPGEPVVRHHMIMGYSMKDLIIFEPLYDPSMCKGTSYFEFHPKELPSSPSCWLPGSMFLRDAAFDFFVECFYDSKNSFDYFSFVRFGSNDIDGLIEELTIYLNILKASPTREQLFSKYSSIFNDEIWTDIPTEPLAKAVLNAGILLRRFIRSETKGSACLWVLGM